jgi:hypothetical protein
MPKRFKSFDNSVPGPWVGGGSAIAADGASGTPMQFLSDPQKVSGTPHTTHLPVVLSHSQNIFYSCIPNIVMVKDIRPVDGSIDEYVAPTCLR